MTTEFLKARDAVHGLSREQMETALAAVIVQRDALALAIDAMVKALGPMKQQMSPDLLHMMKALEQMSERARAWNLNPKV